MASTSPFIAPHFVATKSAAEITLTDSVKKEQCVTQQETELRQCAESYKLLIESAYRPRVRSEALPIALEGSQTIEQGTHSMLATTKTTSSTVYDAATAEVEAYPKSSWVQSMFEIPYEDVMSAHAVNTFVPLMLCRELLPLTGCGDLAQPRATFQP
ncbi:hypothetical protein EK21DRAFT_94185 [Setomelanomma holmii]|uniref:Uncharacterized protein n=1 Tax=Setomelanomma holmii TaxID=210430 RepID=A0A9P4GZJ8_9PLEO|nr:hypothetical protein EK21DRAFT_94185 [Setomelanomma holmii]